MIRRIISILPALFLAAAISGVNATDFGLGTSGLKTFKMNEKVGEPVLKFESSAPLEDITGTVQNSKDISSAVKLDPSNIEKTSGSVSFKVTGLETGIDTRNEHLQSSDWLDAAKYPDIKFELKELKDVKVTESNSSTGKAVAKATAIGTFYLHGKSKSFGVPVELTYLKESSRTKKRASGDLLMVKGSFEIALKDYNVKGSKGVIGSKVGETIEISFDLFFNS